MPRPEPTADAIRQFLDDDGTEQWAECDPRDKIAGKALDLLRAALDAIEDAGPDVEQMQELDAAQGHADEWRIRWLRKHWTG